MSRIKTRTISGPVNSSNTTMPESTIPHFRNRLIGRLLKPDYTPSDLTEILGLLHSRNVFHFPSLPTGLYSAALVTKETESTGYKSAWVRDNVHVLHALLRCGDRFSAVKGVVALCRFFHRHKSRIETILDNPGRASDENVRPHIRFDGETLSEFDTPWPHAQNDALGYFLWLWARRCVNTNAFSRLLDPPVESWEVETVSLLLQYLHVIEYWHDEDSGHWEEDRKTCASSIGVVVAALKRLSALEDVLSPPVRDLCETLYRRGEQSLFRILPFECVQPDPKKNRRCDAALLFLIYPLELLDGDLAETVAENVRRNLLGDYGIKRYLRDSFYCTNYESNIAEDRLTTDWSMSTEERDAHFQDGGEAQWAIFDPVLSVYYARKYRKTRDENDRRRQIWHLNRSLGQITGHDDRYGPFQCPELYYLERDRLQTSRSTPLLWTQANLLLALKETLSPGEETSPTPPDTDFRTD